VLLCCGLRGCGYCSPSCQNLQTASLCGRHTLVKLSPSSSSTSPSPRTPPQTKPTPDLTASPLTRSTPTSLTGAKPLPLRSAQFSFAFVPLAEGRDPSTSVPDPGRLTHPHHSVIRPARTTAPGHSTHPHHPSPALKQLQPSRSPLTCTPSPACPSSRQTELSVLPPVRVSYALYQSQPSRFLTPPQQVIPRPETHTARWTPATRTAKYPRPGFHAAQEVP
jgi:hypothetical protein